MTAVVTVNMHCLADSLKLFFFVLFPFNCSVSPPGGDFSDPVTSATLGIVQVSVDFLQTVVLIHWLIAK